MSDTSTGLYVILTTVGSEVDAEKIADTLLDERLAACINVVPGLRSIYRWEGENVRDREVLLLIKTTAHRYRQVEERVHDLHPYEVPEVVALEAAAVASEYGNWVGDCVEPN